MSSTTEETPSKTIGRKEDGLSYIERRAVRIITKNDQDEIIIIHAKKDNYFKLPGGGIEANEDHAIAVQRESMEETGCEISIVSGCIAEVEEFRNDLHQISYCYIANLEKDTEATDLSDDEVLDGLQHEWNSLNRALERMKAAEPTSELGRYIKERDIFFVQTYAQRSNKK